MTLEEGEQTDKLAVHIKLEPSVLYTDRTRRDLSGAMRCNMRLTLCPQLYAIKYRSKVLTNVIITIKSPLFIFLDKNGRYENIMFSLQVYRKKEYGTDQHR